MKKYTIENLKQAVKNSQSIAEVLRSLGLVTAGGNYQTIKYKISTLSLDISHFTGRGQGKGKNSQYPRRRPLSEVLVETETFVSTSSLKRRLINEGTFDKKCSCCGCKEWMRQPIPLELHHKDGNRRNNKQDNLCLLCPNCHALTPNYRGKNIRNDNPKVLKAKNIKEYVLPGLKCCLNCGQVISEKSIRCVPCQNKCSRVRKTKIIWPDSNILQAMVEASSFLAVSKQLGVSDNAIRKRLKNHHINYKDQQK